MSNKSQKKIGVFLTYMTQVVKIITGLVYTPIMLSIVGQSEYGIYQIADSVISYLVLINLGFLGSYTKFYTVAQKKGEEDVKQVNGIFLLVLLIMSGICVIAGSVILSKIELIFGPGFNQDEYALAKKLMVILIVNMAVTFPIGLFEHNITVNEHFFFVKLINLLNKLLNPFIALPLLLLGYGSIGLVITTTAITIATAVIEIFYCLGKLNMRFSLGASSVVALKSIGGFTFFIFLNQVIDMINWNVDKILIGRFMGSISVAVYSVGGQLRQLFSSFPNAIRTVFQPQMYKMVAQKESEENISMLFTKVGRIQCVILLPILFGFICLGRQFITLWTGKEYLEAYYVALCIMIPISIPHMQDIGIDLQRAVNKHQTRSIVYACIAVMNILLTIPLIKALGIVGAAFATGISLTLGQGFFMNIYYQKVLKIDIKLFWREIVSIIIPQFALAIIFYIVSCFIIVDKWWKLIVMGFIYLVAYMSISYLYIFNPQEKETIKHIMQKMKIIK